MKILIQVKGSVLDAIAAATTYLPAGIEIATISEHSGGLSDWDTISLGLDVPEGMDIRAALARWYTDDAAEVGMAFDAPYPAWTLIHYESKDFGPS
jgi:hypothetical protein